MNTYLTCLSAIYPLHFNLFYQKCKTRETILNIQEFQDDEFQYYCKRKNLLYLTLSYNFTFNHKIDITRIQNLI